MFKPGNLKCFVKAYVACSAMDCGKFLKKLLDVIFTAGALTFSQFLGCLQCGSLVFAQGVWSDRPH